MTTDWREGSGTLRLLFISPPSQLFSCEAFDLKFKVAYLLQKCSYLVCKHTVDGSAFLRFSHKAPIRANTLKTEDGCEDRVERRRRNTRSETALSKSFLSKIHECSKASSALPPTMGRGLRTGLNYSSRESTRWACTICSQGDHAKIVKRPSCEATSTRASRWS